MINVSPSMQDPKRQSPLQIFTRSNVDINKKHYKPFGCPVYVLDKKLQSGKKIEKWKERSKVGIYVGQSPLHNKDVALVLSRFTGYVSPQFHVAIDPGFYTLKQENLRSFWQQKTHFVDAQARPLQSQQPKSKRKRKREGEAVDGAKATPRSQRPEGAAPQGPSQGVTNDAQQVVQRQRTDADQLDQPNENNAEDQTRQSLSPLERSQTEATVGPVAGEQATETPGNSSGERRSGRIRKPVQRLIETMQVEVSQCTTGRIPGEIFCLETLCGSSSEEIGDQHPLMVLKATSDPDTMYRHEAMRQPDRKEFVTAMQKEIDDQMNHGNFSIIPRSEVPSDKKVLPSVWALRRKRDIKTRQVKKYKARLNVNGSKMEYGVHYEETYSPVASWNSIRLLLALTSLHGWHTAQLDYVQVYPQAPVEREIYMEVPKGSTITGKDRKSHVLKLHRNVYGQKQAGRVWNKYLVDKLVNKVGFKQSKVDECVFYKGQVMYVLYTDDSILAGPNKEEVDKVIEQIRKAKLDITVEGDIQDFLGVRIDRKEDGTIEFTQPHLIDKVLKATRLDREGVKPKDTPAAASRILKRHSDSPPFQKDFHYRSVIGMLNYLEKGSRSDIAYATHQCVRFVEDPKVEHGDAVRWIARYLKGTRDKGMTFDPDIRKGLEVYVDADFAGNWDKKEAASDRDTARSRHGYIIKFAGCPIVWKSQLQTEIALSSTEAEYTGLSYALREVIPIIELLKEMRSHGFQVAPPYKSRNGQPHAHIHCKVFEDNSGAIEMAKVHKYRPRTKHLNVKLHHFRSWVKSKAVSIHAIASEEQLADYLTKPVNFETLSRLRKKVLGW